MNSTGLIREGGLFFCDVLRKKEKSEKTEESIMKWAKMVLGDNRTSKIIYFIRVEGPGNAKNIVEYQ